MCADSTQRSAQSSLCRRRVNPDGPTREYCAAQIAGRHWAAVAAVSTVYGEWCKVRNIFGFCDIRKFESCTEHLEKEIFP